MEGFVKIFDYLGQFELIWICWTKTFYSSIHTIYDLSNFFVACKLFLKKNQLLKRELGSRYLLSNTVTFTIRWNFSLILISQTSMKCCLKTISKLFIHWSFKASSCSLIKLFIDYLFIFLLLLNQVYDFFFLYF